MSRVVTDSGELLLAVDADGDLAICRTGYIPAAKVPAIVKWLIACFPGAADTPATEAAATQQDTEWARKMDTTTMH